RPDFNETRAQASNERARGSAWIDPVPVTASTLAGGHRSGSHRSVGAATTAATHLLRRDMTEREHSALICAWLEGWVAWGDEGRPARPADQPRCPGDQPTAVMRVGGPRWY